MLGFFPHPLLLIKEIRIETEEDHKGYALKATFDGGLLKKIQGLKLNLKMEDNIFSKMQRMFSRSKINYHEYQELEKVIEITQTTGKHKLNLLTKPMINQILRKIPKKKKTKDELCSSRRNPNTS